LRRQQELRTAKILTKPRLYVPAGRAPEGLAAAKATSGKELSTTISSISKRRAAWPRIQESRRGDHQAQRSLRDGEQATLREAYLKALACDPVRIRRSVGRSPCGGCGDRGRSPRIVFVECIAAPAFADHAKEIFAEKKNLRLLELAPRRPGAERELQLKRHPRECWCSNRTSAKLRTDALRR